MDRLTWLALLIGVVLGALFGFSGFGDPGKTSDLSKNPRVKNLLWLLGGAATVLLADWKPMSDKPISPTFKASLLLSYGQGAVGTAIVVIFAFVVVILVSASGKARRQPAFRGKAGDLVLAYLSSGYARYSAQVDALEQRGRAADPEANHGEFGRSLAFLIATTALDRTQDVVAQREVFIDQTLDAMAATVKLFAVNTDVTLNLNYMAFVAADRLGTSEPIFVQFGDRTKYQGYLVPRRYRNGVAARVCLPVESNADSKTLLPGAPTCVATREAYCLEPRKLVFRDEVAKKIQTEVRAFFKTVPYRSVLSVPLIWGGGVVGVANIESTEIDVVGRGPDMIGQIGKALAPHCVVLGELVHRAEGA